MTPSFIREIIKESWSITQAGVCIFRPLCRFIQPSPAVSIFQELPGFSLPLAVFLLTYENYHPAYRKAALLCTRFRGDSDDSILWAQIPKSDYPVFVSYFPGGIQFKFKWKQIVKSILYASTFDLTNSLISAFIRAKMYRKDVAEQFERESFEDSAAKEINATQGPDRPQQLNYNAIFSSPSTEALHPTIGVQRINGQILETFRTFKANMEGKTLWPRASRKHLSQSTALESGRERITGKEWLSDYYWRGEQWGGIMEIRQCWRFNDLTPRTYFAMGGDMFKESMYVQEIFNILMDMFEPTHRRRRFDLGRLDIDDDEDVWIYDYSSFTSNCTEQKHFLAALADFLMGTIVFIFDIREGKIPICLGTLIKTYNDKCNRRPFFGLGPKLLERLGWKAMIYRHERAGALGVYGNLASCTILHGILSMNISQSPKKSSVVGDDGILSRVTRLTRLEDGETGMTTLDEIRDMLRLLGDIQDTKFAVLGPSSGPYRSCWTYLKRSLIRHDHELELLPQEHVVNLSLFLNEHTPTMRKTSTSVAAEIESFLIQSLNLLLRIHRDQAEILDEELVAICMLYGELYKKYALPFVGSLTGATIKTVGKSYKSASLTVHIGRIIPYIPKPEHSYHLRYDPIQVLAEKHPFVEYPVTVPMVRPRSSPSHDDMATFCRFRCSSSRPLALLVVVGIMSKETLVEEMKSLEDFLEFRRRLFRRDHSILYEFTVLNPVPLFFVDACCC